MKINSMECWICKSNTGESGSFALLKVSQEDAVPPKEIVTFCELLRDKSVYTPQV